MITSKLIKEMAIKYGASNCGIGTLDAFKGADKQRDPYMILPGAKCIIGFEFRVPSGLYKAMENGNQVFSYTTFGVKNYDEEFAEIFLLRMGALIEDDGWDACLQRSYANLRTKGDTDTNPEVMDTYVLDSDAVEEGKACPDVVIDFGTAAKACGLGEKGLSGKVISKKYGPYVRYAFIITDAPLETDAELDTALCDNCGKCIEACPGKAISDKGLDTWQCAVYYRGAHKSNPRMTEDFLKDDPNREAILNGDYRFDSESARSMFKKLNFLPEFKGYAPCFCAKKCDTVCYNHLKEVGKI